MVECYGLVDRPRIELNVSVFERVNTIDTCSIWKILSSPQLVIAARAREVSFLVAEYVRYEALEKRRTNPSEREIALRLEFRSQFEAEIKAIAPELDLPHRRRELNPDFARGELPRIAMDILRMAAGPMAVRDIATKALARKGITLPDRRTMKRTRLALQKVFAIWAKRGVVIGVGTGNGRKRVLAER